MLHDNKTLLKNGSYSFSLSLFSFEWKESMTLSNTIVRLRMCEKKSHGKFLFFSHIFDDEKKACRLCKNIMTVSNILKRNETKKYGMLMINSVIHRSKRKTKKFRIISCRDWIYFFYFHFLAPLWFYVTIRQISLDDDFIRQFTLCTNCCCCWCRDICHNHHHYQWNSAKCLPLCSLSSIKIL